LKIKVLIQSDSTLMISFPKKIAPKYPKNDGKKTPMRGHPVFIVQHAPAACRRGCIQRWHGIGKDRALNNDEIEFVKGLVMGWIEDQIDC
jgi:hypothetical protein